ncbi:MAG: ABC transporter ATP-binding protein [Runella sp.]
MKGQIFEPYPTIYDLMFFFELQHISKKFHQNTILQDITFGVKRGEIFGLLGESGSGKSTLLRIAARLLDADNGNVLLGGQALPSAGDRLIPGHPDIKIVHQDYQLSLPLTVRENIAYALRFYEKNYRDERTDELLALCQLEKVATQPAKSLSGGEKQRTAIARALAEEARVLLLDEPFAHLDLPNRHRLAETLRELVEQLAIACIFVTHDATDALRLSHRVGVMKEGQLIQIGTPEALYRTPTQIYTAEMTGISNWIEVERYNDCFGKIPTSAWIIEHQILVRPEQFVCSRKASANSLEVKIVRCVFEGSYYHVHFSLGDTTWIACSHVAFGVGERAFVQILFR